jgi:ATP-dependent DNA helicase RecG
LQNSDKVLLKIQGKILDENYTRVLLQNADIDLDTAIALDKVQKGYEIVIGHSKAAT